MDVFSRRERSRIMSLIRSRGNAATELRLIEVFRAHKITGWRRNQEFVGKPDFVFRLKRLIIFADGCFWHGCKQHCRLPAAHRSYWVKKIARNKSRDRAVSHALRQRGWRVLRIWQHELKQRNERRLISRIQRMVATVDDARCR